jgi:glutamyl-tRNA synthetase
MTGLKVRFAPSPTGYLHVGGARTALFNYLLAKQQGGSFLLRIEDTDTERSTQESVDAIIQGMEWLGLKHDEGPIFQSDRFPLYKEYIQKLLDEGKAYKCYCTQEEVDARRDALKAAGEKPKYDRKCIAKGELPGVPYCVRFKTPDEGRTEWDDAIKGKISFPNGELDDIIIQRTDGTPTYNFVVVVDDATMGQTLIIRGDDHVNNTPRQILIYEALGMPVPRFAHVPMILGADGQRLSKRHGATSVMAYRDMGYLPEALLNYLARLGWSNKNDEIFSMEELIQKFSIENVGRAAGIFNMEKLNWLNQHYIKSADPVRLASLVLTLLRAKEEFWASNAKYVYMDSLVAAVKTLQTRCKTLVEMAAQAMFYYIAPKEFDMEALTAFDKDHLTLVCSQLMNELKTCTDGSVEGYAKVIKAISDDNSWTMKHIGQPIRVALSGTRNSPGLDEVMSVLGSAECTKRLETFITSLG